MDQATTIADLPRYGAATLNGTQAATGGGTHIKWGGVIKGAVVVGAALLAGYGVFLGASWLLGGTAAGTALSGAATNAWATVSPTLYSAGATFSAWATHVIAATPAFLNTWALQPLIGALSYSWGLVNSGLAALNIITPAAANASALAAATPVTAAAAASTANTVAAVAGLGTVALAAPTVIHNMPSMLDHNTMQIAEHTVTHHAADHTVESGDRAVARAAAANKTWADRVSSPASNATNFADKIDAQTAQLDKALKTV